jgi:hypothetical protein
LEQARIACRYFTTVPQAGRSLMSIWSRRALAAASCAAKSSGRVASGWMAPTAGLVRQTPTDGSLRWYRRPVLGWRRLFWRGRCLQFVDGHDLDVSDDLSDFHG